VAWRDARGGGVERGEVGVSLVGLAAWRERE